MAKEAARYGFFFGSGSIISYNDIAYKRDISTQDDWLQQMILSIRAGAKETALDQLNTYMDSLYKEAEQLTQAARYERSEARQGYRSGHYDRNLTTTSGDVKLHMPRLKGVSFETANLDCTLWRFLCTT